MFGLSTRTLLAIVVVSFLVTRLSRRVPPLPFIG